MAKARMSELHKQLKGSDSKPKQHSKQKTVESVIEANVPRGERSDFLKLTITMPSDMMTAIKVAGMKRKATGMKDCDTSALIREAVSEWLKRQ